MEEFGPKLEYIKGEKNFIADTLSRLSRKEDQDVSPIIGKNDAPSSDINIESLESFYSIFDDSNTCHLFNEGLDEESNLLDFVKEHDCFLNLPEINEGENPLDIENIKNLQDSDEELQKLKDKHPEIYFYKDINKTKNVLCYVRPGKDKDENWKIVLPKKLLNSTIKWFHIITGHSGWNRLYMTIAARYYHPDLKTKARSFKCDLYQKHKLPGKGYGLLPERELKE